MSDRPSFVYVSYIATTADRLWTALTDGKFTREYWGGRAIESEWKAGSTFVLRKLDGTADGASGKVLEVDRPTRLVLTWSLAQQKQTPSPASRVTFTIAAAGPENVRLEVVHEEYEAGSQVPDQVREGWSAILSSLKSYLETGRALEATRRWAASGR